MLREPHDLRVLVYPAAEIQSGRDSIFAYPAAPELPPRYVAPWNEQQPQDPCLDPDGLLDVERARDGGALALSELLRQRSHQLLVVAPPWTGKSYVAERVAESFLRKASPAGQFVERTDLERTDSLADARPRDWTQWRASRGELLWIVDAVDEALHRGGTLAPIARQLEDLSDDERQRLRLVLFARDDDTPGQVLRTFPAMQCYRLLPIDRVEAARSLEAAESSGSSRLEQALTLLHEMGLKDWARHVPVLRQVAALPSVVDPNELRDSILERLCREDGARAQHRNVPSRQLLDVAARLAAVTVVSNKAELAEDDARGVAPSALLRSSDETTAFRALQRTGPLLQRTPRGYRFRQRYAEELLAARGLQEVRPGALLTLMTHGGRLRSELTVVADELKRRLPALANRLDAWARAETRPLPPEKAASVVADIEKWATASTFWVRPSPRACRRFDHFETRALLRTRLENTSLPTPARQLFLRIARENRWTSFATTARSIALESLSPWELREEAIAFLSELGDRTDREALSGLLQDAAPESANARAELLRWALREGEDPLTIAEQLPAPEPCLADLRTVLLHALEARLEVPHARTILQARKQSASTRIDRRVLESLAPRAAELLLEQDRLAESDLELIVSEANRQTQDVVELARRLSERLRSDTEVRRTYYLRFRDDRSTYFLFLHQPPDEDAEWLLGQFRTSTPPADAFKDLARFTLTAGRETAERITDYLSNQRLAEFEGWQRRAQEEEAEINAAQAAQEAPHAAARAHWLGDLVDNVLAATDAPAAQLHALSQLCFDERLHADVEGRFVDLSSTLQQRVVDTVKQLLTRVEPTPLPGYRRPFPTAIRLEASAFRAVVTWEDPATWLTPELVGLWLPTLLFVRPKECTEVIVRCIHMDGDTTIGSLVEAIRLEVGRRDVPGVLYEIPDSIWPSSALRDACITLIEDQELVLHYRAPLLRWLAEHDWSPPLRKLIHRLKTTTTTELRLAALACLVRCEPSAVLTELDPRMSNEELASALAPILPLRSRAGRDRLREWSLDDSLALLLLLARRELRERPLGIAYGVTPEDELRDLRRQLTSHVAQVTSEASREETLRRLEPANISIASELRAEWASRAVSELFQEAPFEPPSVKDIVNALEEGEAVRFRSVDDLAETLLECIEQIRENSKNHIELFTAGAKTHERVLQSYVAMRIDDLLPRVAPKHVIFTFREPKEGREEPDLLEGADSEGKAQLAVPIEIKWSHNNECVSALAEQLGERYLIRSQRTRGIYVVGFTGVERNKDRARLEEQLLAEVSRFEGLHPEVKIDVCILDTQLREKAASERSAVVHKP